MNRKIAVFTGSRSEYGLQFPILRAIAADPRLDYYLLVGGAHLLHDFGETSREIEQDGFRIHARLQIPPPSNPSTYTAESIARGILAVSAVLAELRPDFLVLYGDRFESFAAMMKAGLGENKPNWAYTTSGVPYISALPNAPPPQELKNQT